MTLHAIQTGSVRIKTAQVHGRGRGLSRQLRVFADRHWTGWLPTYAWAIDHPEGVIVVDTGQGTHLLESARSLHPYQRWEVMFRIEPDDEIGPRLRAIGIGPRDVRRVVLTHLHADHDGGLAHFPHSEILVSRGELRRASGWMGRVRGYLPHRWPSWFDPVPLDLLPETCGPFATSRRLTAAGDVTAVGTPGHTAHHLSILVEDRGTTYMLAGDSSYNQAMMLAAQIDGVSVDEDAARTTLRAIRRLASERPTVYLPTHDPESAERLLRNRVVEKCGESSAADQRSTLPPDAQR